MHIGILHCGYLAPAISARTGEYPAMFERLLAGRGFTFTTYAVVDGEVPDDPALADGWLITGSKHGVYEDHPWIPPLEDLVRAIHASGRPLVGICFGHQIIAQALGGTVRKADTGWIVGPQVYDFDGTPVTLHGWHQDQVITPPPGAHVLATGPDCPYAALDYGHATWSVQAHPEFDDVVVAGLLDHRAPGVVPQPLIDRARAGLGTHLDRDVAADRISSILKGDVHV